MPIAISRQELHAAIDDPSVTVIDALPPAPYARRHLPGAINVVAEHTDEQIRAALPEAAATIVTYSTDEHCTRGPELAARLQALGYRHVWVYEDGIEDWIAAGLPIDQSHSDASASAPATTRLTPLPDGPYQVTGPIEILRPDGAPIPVAEPIYLCRCGRSANKPFCDGSHARTGWRELA